MIAKSSRGERALSDNAYEQDALQAGQLWFGGRSSQSTAQCCSYRTAQVSNWTCHSGKETRWALNSTTISSWNCKDTTTLSNIQWRLFNRHDISVRLFRLTAFPNNCAPVKREFTVLAARTNFVRKNITGHFSSKIIFIYVSVSVCLCVCISGGK
jgi:hypothetical protein